MSIDQIKFENGLLHKNGTIRFSKGSIATIVGLNGHGKSMLLDSFLKNNALSLKGFGNKVISFSYKLSNSDFESFKDISKSPFPDIIKLKDMSENNFENHYKYLVKECYEQIYARAEGVKKIIPLHNISDKIIPTTLDSTYILMNAERRIFTEYINMFSSWMTKVNAMLNKFRGLIKTVKINPELGISRMSVFFNEINAVDPQKTIDGNGRFIVSIAAKIKEKIPAKQGDLIKFTDKISKEFSNQIGNTNISTIFKGTWIPQNNGFYIDLEFRDSENQITWDQLSTGTRRYISMMAQLGNVNQYTVVLIDEPETGLHPLMQKNFRYMLQQVATDVGCRFIIITHSQYMLNSLSNRINVYVSYKDKNIFLMKDITKYHNEDLEGIQIWNLLGIGENTTFNNINSKSKVILVEGVSDQLYLKKFFSMNEKKLDNWQILPAGGGGRLKYMGNYCLSVGVKKENLILIADGDVINSQKNRKETEEEFNKVAQTYFIKFKKIEDVFEERTKIQLKSENSKNRTAMNFVQNNCQLGQKEKEHIKNMVKDIDEMLKNK